MRALSESQFSKNYTLPSDNRPDVRRDIRIFTSHVARHPHRVVSCVCRVVLCCVVSCRVVLRCVVLRARACVWVAHRALKNTWPVLWTLTNTNANLRGAASLLPLVRSFACSHPRLLRGIGLLQKGQRSHNLYGIIRSYLFPPLFLFFPSVCFAYVFLSGGFPSRYCLHSRTPFFMCCSRIFACI